MHFVNFGNEYGRTLITLFRFGAVVVAEGHNPTILHPSFLKAQGVVDQDWELSQDPICTPPLANVVFNNGISVIVDQSRLQVNAEGADVVEQVGVAADVAEKYVSQLPHVNYSGVGLNYTGFLEHTDAAQYLIHRFVKDGPWNQGRLLLENFTPQFQYRYDDCDLYLSLSVGSRTDRESRDETAGIIVHANYHYDCDGVDDVSQALRQALRLRDDYFKTVRAVLGE